MDLGRRITRNSEHQYIGSGIMVRALLSALLFLTSGLAAQAANDIAQIKQGLDSPVIVDVRSEEEYASGAIDGALNHPLQGLPGTLLDMGVEIINTNNRDAGAFLILHCFTDVLSKFYGPPPRRRPKAAGTSRDHQLLK